MTGYLVLPFLAVMATTTTVNGQALSVTASSVNLAAPDTLAYDAGLTPAGAFSVLVTGCAAVLGCRVSIENPHATSIVPVDVQWRLVHVSQSGAGSLGCTPVTGLLTWQPVPASPVGLMDTAIVDAPGTACAAAIEVRATGVSYSVHGFTWPPTTYWRELRFRIAEK